MEESIYNIVPREYNPPAKGATYKSKYPPNIPPTGSTFNNHTTSKPGVGNLNGEFSMGLQAHTEYGGTKTFGHLKGDRRPSPQNFTKMHTGTMGNETLPPIRNFSYDCTYKKVQVPCVNEKPVMGLKSNKNFIVTNAIENILSSAKRAPQQVNYLKKKDYGRTPEYIQKIKENVQNQYSHIQALHEQRNSAPNCLSEEQVRQIRQGLKNKWNQINREYQKITHVKNVDTIGLKAKKERYQRELAQIQGDIKKLNKLYIFVE